MAHLNFERTFMKIIYYVLFILINLTMIHPQGVDFPNEPVQAPLNGLGLLVAFGLALAYKRFKK